MSLLKLFYIHSGPLPFHPLGWLLAGCPCEGQVYSAWLRPGHRASLSIRDHICTAPWVNWVILGHTVQVLPFFLPSSSDADYPRQLQLCDANFLFGHFFPTWAIFGLDELPGAVGLRVSAWCYWGRKTGHLPESHHLSWIRSVHMSIWLMLLPLSYLPALFLITEGKEV